MITQISDVGHIQAFAVPIVPRSGLPALEDVQKENSQPEKSIVFSMQVSGLFAQLSSRQEEGRMAALAVRETDNTIDYASQLLGKIEDKLGEIVKMFPPYPIDSPQRISLLNNIGGLRKQIDSLTHLSEGGSDALSNLVGAKINSTRSDSGSAVSVNGTSVASISEEVISLLKNPSDKYSLEPSSASDEEVEKAFAQIKDVQFALRELQGKMWQDVVNYVNQSNSSEAENNTSSFREQMANMGNLGIGSNAQRLVLMLGLE